jgi:hypothetical protein
VSADSIVIAAAAAAVAEEPPNAQQDGDKDQDFHIILIHSDLNPVAAHLEQDDQLRSDPDITVSHLCDTSMLELSVLGCSAPSAIGVCRAGRRTEYIGTRDLCGIRAKSMFDRGAIALACLFLYNHNYGPWV